MPIYKANLRIVINFDVEVEADTEKDAVACMDMRDDPSADRTFADVVTAFDPELEMIKAGGIIVRQFKELK